MLDINKTHNLDVLEGLRQIDDNSIDLCVTSPPYWSLRSYKTQSQIWGGQKDCEHDWIANDKFKKINLQAGNPEFQRKWRENASDNNSNIGCFCSKCGAWRGELGLEPTFQLYIEHLIQIFSEVKRVLKPTGSCYVNISDTYASGGNPNRHNGFADPKYPNGRNGEHSEPSSYPQIGASPKSLCQIPTRFSIAMTDKLGFILRNTIIWHKNNCMPSSASDRYTVDFEYMFFFTKNKKYYFEQQLEPYTKEMNRWGGNKLTANGVSTWDNGTGQDSYRERNMRPNENGRNKRCVWSINTSPSPDYVEHYASYPEELIETPIKASCPQYVCQKCGKPRETIRVPVGTLDNVLPEVISDKSKPYSVVEREGYIELRDLPSKIRLKEYLTLWRKKSGYTIDQIESILGSQSPHHWFNGESYPTKEDWFKIKELLKFDDKYDSPMTIVKYKPAEKLSGSYKTIQSSCNCGVGFHTGIVLDPFMGSGTTGAVAKSLCRNYIGLELNPNYCAIADKRTYKVQGADEGLKRWVRA